MRTSSSWRARHERGNLPWEAIFLRPGAGCAAHPAARRCRASGASLRLRVALSADLSLGECQKIIERADKDGTGTLDFREFEAIVKDRA